MTIFDLPTPQVLVERARLEANVDRMQAAASAHRRRLRPHAKTHKSIVIARLQLARGAAGICCARVGEAEVFAHAGIPDIRLAYPVSPFSATRLADLMDRTRISIIVDDEGVAREWSDAMRARGRRLDVLVKVDVGFHRCGIDPEDERAAGMVCRVADMPGLRFRGLLSHAGHAYGADSEDALRQIARDEAAALRELARRVEAAGTAVEEISVGATPTVRFSTALDGLTELRPGNYVYFDRTQIALGAAARTDCALSVLATVVSRPAADRLVLDCGSKTLSSDGVRGPGHPTGYGLVFPDPEAPAPDEGLEIVRLSEEHAVVRIGGASHLRPGDRVRVLPNHACVVVNLTDAVHLVDGREIVETVTVDARGRSA